MANIDRIMRVVVKRLGVIAEAGKKRPDAGTWHDIDNGAGGSIYLRREPKRRGAATARRESDKRMFAVAGEKWDSMDESERRKFLLGSLGWERWFVDGEDGEPMTTLSWTDISRPGFISPESVRDIASGLETWSPRAGDEEKARQKWNSMAPGERKSIVDAIYPEFQRRGISGKVFASEFDDAMIFFANRREFVEQFVKLA